MPEITTTAPSTAQQPTVDQLAERIAAIRETLRERMGCPLTDEELDQGPDVLANLYALAAEKVRARGQLPPPEWVRGQSARGR
ncbi:hypothetical protein [Streptomyces spongiae]|uniref:Uncharacterized protein n=1 Tax=Streptomyces spongiae TaxID=565072 RepID=A0A5N8XTG3_9ACTN|nr:hypothetical protein [Streptomyces spongiae]MPY62338.1 hypothetical protein [Streptomyces spongiae]